MGLNAAMASYTKFYIAWQGSLDVSKMKLGRIDTQGSTGGGPPPVSEIA
jgi:hypothetical protein